MADWKFGGNVWNVNGIPINKWFRISAISSGYGWMHAGRIISASSFVKPRSLGMPQLGAKSAS